jgi:endonuclease G, mitochondrial
MRIELLLILLPFVFGTDVKCAVGECCKKACNVVLNYPGFKLDYSCFKKSADRFTYALQGKAGDSSVRRRNEYYIDDKLPHECQQRSTASYSNINRGYDRGHLVPSSHMNHQQNVNIMANIVPQAKEFNHGQWHQTERISLCYRPMGVKVFGGVIYLTNRTTTL